MKPADQLAETRGDLLRAQRAIGLARRTRDTLEDPLKRHMALKLAGRAEAAAQVRLEQPADGLEAAREILTITSEGLSRTADPSLRKEWQALVDDAQRALGERMQRAGSLASIPTSWVKP